MFFKSECEIGNSHYKILNQILFDLEIIIGNEIKCWSNAVDIV